MLGGYDAEHFGFGVSASGGLRGAPLNNPRNVIEAHHSAKRNASAPQA